VVDTRPPVSSQCPTNRALTAGPNCPPIIPDMRAQIAATDDCGPVTVWQSPLLTQVGLGTYPVVFTVCDACTNCVTCTNYVTVSPAQLSANIVGGFLISVPAGGSSLIADPLKNTTNNTIGNLIPNPPPGTIVRKWSGSGGTWDQYIFDPIDLTWLPNGLATLNPGEGGILVNGDPKSP